MKQTREQNVTYYQTDEPEPDNNMLPIAKLMNQNQTTM